MEEFRNINYKGNLFTVSSTGRIFKNGNEITPVKNRDGYLQVSIKNEEGIWTTVSIHRLVALTFIPNNDKTKNEVNHKDYNRNNNNVENLEWVSHKENILYSLCNKPDITGKNNPNYGNKKLSEYYKNNPDMAYEKQSRKGLQNGRCRKIELYYNGKYIQTFDYILLCCKYLIDHGVTKRTPDGVRSIIDTCVRLNKTYKGYSFIKK